jgi:hypothetical protein
LSVRLIPAARSCCVDRDGRWPPSP